MDDDAAPGSVQAPGSPVDRWTHAAGVRFAGELRHGAGRGEIPLHSR